MAQHMQDAHYFTDDMMLKKNFYIYIFMFIFHIL